jgi:hypothetical protein
MKQIIKNQHNEALERKQQQELEKKLSKRQWLIQ